MGLLTSPCLWVILICDFPRPFSADARRGVSSWPHKKGPKCPYRPSLIRKQRCVRPCHSSAVHIGSLDAFRYAIILSSCSLCLCVLGVDCTVRRGEQDERMMEGRAACFPLALKAAVTRVQESCTLPKGFPRAACKLRDRRGNYLSSHLLLSTPNYPSQAKCGVMFPWGQLLDEVPHFHDTFYGNYCTYFCTSAGLQGLIRRQQVLGQGLLKGPSPGLPAHIKPPVTCWCSSHG